MTIPVLEPFKKIARAAAADGDENSRASLTSAPNAWRDGFLSFQIVPVRQPRINTVFVDSLDVDDLVTTETGDLRYLGDQVFYVAWVEATTARAPFVVGLNAIIIPRPQFLNSSANHTLRTTTDPILLPDHLGPLTFTAFDEAAGETTNAIAGVLHGTLTGDQTLALLGDLTRGRDGGGNGMATVVTGDLVTLGLADDLVNAIPFAGVRFDATDKGPGDLLGDFVDAFVGAATFVVRGLVLIGEAIAAFFAQAAAFLAELGMAVIGAIAEFLGQVADAVEAVGRALEAFVQFFVQLSSDLIRSLLDAALRPLIDAIAQYIAGIQTAFRLGVQEFEETGTVSTDTGKGMMDAILNLFFNAIFVTVIALLITVIVLTFSVPVMSLLLGLLPSLILLILLPFLGVEVGTPGASVETAGIDLSSGAAFDLTASLVGSGAAVGPAALGVPTQLSDSSQAGEVLEFMSLAFGGMSLLIDARIIDFLLSKGVADVTGILWLALAITLITVGVILSIYVLSIPEPARGLLENAFSFTALMLDLLGLIIAVLLFVKVGVKLPQVVPLVQLSALFAGIGIFLGFLSLVV